MADNQIASDSYRINTICANAITGLSANQTAAVNGATDLVNNKESGGEITYWNNEKRRLGGGAGPQGTNPQGGQSFNPNVGAFYGV